MKRILTVAAALLLLSAGCSTRPAQTAPEEGAKQTQQSKSAVSASAGTQEAAAPGADEETASANSGAEEPALESEAAGDEAIQEDPIWVNTYAVLQKRPEFVAVLAEKKNVTSTMMPEASVDWPALKAFLQAFESKEAASFELYQFSTYDYSHYLFETNGGSITNTGEETLYGVDKPETTWKVEDIPFVELLCSGQLYFHGAQMYEDGVRGDLSLPLYSSQIDDPYLQAFHRYMKPIEFTALTNSWDEQSSMREIGQWMFYFEDVYREENGGETIWDAYPTGVFPASFVEDTVGKHFDISPEELRQAVGDSVYEAATNTYHYEGGRGGLYMSTTRILDLAKDGDKTRITYSFDQMQADMDASYLFETVNGREQICRGEEMYLLTVQNTPDGFRYLSNKAV